MELDGHEMTMMKELQLLTAKPVLYVCNVEEAAVVNGNAYVDRVKEVASSEGAAVMIIGAAIEADIAELDDSEERAMFLEDMGLKEPGVAQLIRKAYELLNLKTYFTAGVKEVRAWTYPDGATAPQAAGVIHTDFEKGFIRAETISYEDFVANDGWVNSKTNGKMRLEGKDYIVKDGDVLNFRFNT